MTKLESLLNKYFGSGGRYTYYPPISSWENSLQSTDWISHLKTSNPEKLNLYIHIPFCGQLCSFCGCNMKVRNNFSEVDTYLDKLEVEISTYRKVLPDAKVESLYLGGGTPNILSPDQLTRLMSFLPEKTENFEGTLEADPRLLFSQQTTTLKSLGFSKISFGVQDLTPSVLQNVGRTQTYEQVKNAVLMAKEAGIEQVFVDMIYGLPFQTEENLKDSFINLLELPIDGVTYYPLAKVPWQEKTQSAFGNFESVEGEEKVRLYMIGREALVEKDFFHLGFGHFVSKNSKSYKDFKNNKLKRTPMGVSSHFSNNLLGLGVSSISRINGMLVQNERVLEKYYYLLDKSQNAFFRSHKQNELQKETETFYLETFQNNSLELFCQNQDQNLDSLVQDEILSLTDGSLKLSEFSREFFKTIFQNFDPNLQ